MGVRQQGGVYTYVGRYECCCVSLPFFFIVVLVASALLATRLSVSGLWSARACFLPLFTPLQIRVLVSAAAWSHRSCGFSCASFALPYPASRGVGAAMSEGREAMHLNMSRDSRSGSISVSVNSAKTKRGIGDAKAHAPWVSSRLVSFWRNLLRSALERFGGIFALDEAPCSVVVCSVSPAA